MDHFEAANRLHHLSMRYVGAFAELAWKQPIAFLPPHPGMKEMRDLIDLILLTRAEINAMTKLCVDKKVFTVEEWVGQCTEEYIWFADQKAEQLGVGLSPVGLVYTTDVPDLEPDEMWVVVNGEFKKVKRNNVN